MTRLRIAALIMPGVKLRGILACCSKRDPRDPFPGIAAPARLLHISWFLGMRNRGQPQVFSDTVKGLGQEVSADQAHIYNDCGTAAIGSVPRTKGLEFTRQSQPSWNLIADGPSQESESCRAHGRSRTLIAAQRAHIFVDMPFCDL